MDQRVERELRHLEDAVSRVVDQSRTFASTVDAPAEVVEDLQQIAIGLKYEVETLKAKLNLETVRGKPISK